MDNINAKLPTDIPTGLEFLMKGNTQIFFILIFVFNTVFIGCVQALLGPVPSTEPPSLFDNLWNEFDKRYSLFGVHGIDWDSMYTHYHPFLSSNTSEATLIAIIDSLLFPLHDRHVTFYANTNSGVYDLHFGEHYLDSAVSFQFNIVSSFYLRQTAEITGYGKIIYGFINDSIGYVYLPSFDESSDSYGWANQFGDVLNQMKTVTGLILDVRGNSGGSQKNLISILSHFFSQRQSVLYTRLRNGPSHSDFSPPEALVISPSPNIIVSKPIVVLADRFTVSSGEWFVLAMKTLHNVRVVGDTTSGSLSGRLDRELPNGWTYSLSIEKITDVNGTAYDGRGIPPDVTVHQIRLAQGMVYKDSILDEAIKLFHN